MSKYKIAIQKEGKSWLSQWKGPTIPRAGQTMIMKILIHSGGKINQYNPLEKVLAESIKATRVQIPTPLLLGIYLT